MIETLDVEATGGSPRLKVFLYDNEMAPYKFPLYEELSHHWDLSVFFGRARGTSRVWSLNPAEYPFRFEVLRSFSLGPIVFNPTLPFRVLDSFDVYIVAGAGLQYAFGMLTSLILGRLLKKPVVFWVEGFEPNNPIPVDYGLAHRLKRLLERQLYVRLLYRLPRFFLTHGARPAREIEEGGAVPERIFETLSAVPDLDERSRQLAPDIEQDLKGKRVILTAAYLTKRKGVDLLIRAFRQVSGEDLCLVIMGDGKERSRLEELAKGDDRIRFVGYCEGQKKHTYFAVAEIFVLASYYDPWGLVVNEAMQWGCAVIATDSTGCVERLVRDGENGFVVKAGNVEELVRALQKVVEDPELSRRMGARSREVIGENGISAMARDFRLALEKWSTAARMKSGLAQGADRPQTD